ncbi:MAG: hypothetical protein J0H80_02305, partial [Rhizobiales bacterium]|nr:hypothetical protein [Hyphomicrobiales bacterium]
TGVFEKNQKSRKPLILKPDSGWCFKLALRNIENIPDIAPSRRRRPDETAIFPSGTLEASVQK